jgi:hypothetical protein
MMLLFEGLILFAVWIAFTRVLTCDAVLGRRGV